MSNLRATARASARIRQLAALDISGPQLAPMLLQELHALLPFEVGIYTHTATDGSYHYFVDEQHAAKQLTPQSVDPLYVTLENEVLRSAEQSVLCEFGPTPMAEAMCVPRSEFLQHPFYTEALRPAGGDDGVRFLPRRLDGQPVGRLLIGRDSRKHHGRVINRAELQAMARVQHWLAHALEPRQPAATLEYDSQEIALLVIGSDLRLRHLSPNAERLLSLAFGGRWRRNGSLPEDLLHMLRSLRLINHDEPAMRPPVLDKISPWGRFNFRAHFLSATPENVSDCISANANVSSYGITVTHEVPKALRLITALRNTDLPQRQTEICYWLARGWSHRQIAEHCGISINTAIYHSRQIYAQFNANNRKELAESVLSQSVTRH
jgi:DNA-binding CsgD family transcriptional regulator